MAERKTTTLAGWKKNREHTVMCPSGTYVTIRIPDLPRMIEAGHIPQHLLDAAIGVAMKPDQEPSLELIKQQREFSDRLVMLSVVDPKISESDLEDIPYEDMEFIVAVSTRQRDLDVLGRHIAGLTDLKEFRQFRQLGEFDTSMEGV